MKRLFILLAVLAMSLLAMPVSAAKPALSFEVTANPGPFQQYQFDRGYATVQWVAEPSRNGPIAEYIYAFRHRCYDGGALVSDVAKWVDFHGANSDGEAWFNFLLTWDYCTGVVTVGFNGSQVGNTAVYVIP